MTKLELVAETLAEVCRFSTKCHWKGGECPFGGVRYCETLNAEDWMKYLTQDERYVANPQYTEIIQRLDRIEKRQNANEDPKSLSAFVSQKIKEAAHR